MAQITITITGNHDDPKLITLLNALAGVPTAGATDHHPTVTAQALADAGNAEAAAALGEDRAEAEDIIALAAATEGIDAPVQTMTEATREAELSPQQKAARTRAANKAKAEAEAAAQTTAPSVWAPPVIEAPTLQDLTGMVMGVLGAVTDMAAKGKLKDTLIGALAAGTGANQLATLKPEQLPIAHSVLRKAIIDNAPEGV